ncbi:hypothetical protein FVE85_9143 [Porphyridium purpureum]|uniref:CCHC-type domain-containing protein n=1 Tax=Porphyridium purpureum TaxID=35688 RepID=A0A5J4YMZ2_PORPP|nr:hypothetical protein FVE85_9143 [Porphyridium purpureum]|eukprot:POR1836..scf222_8
MTRSTRNTAGAGGSSDGDRRIGAAAEQFPDQDTQVNVETNREDVRLVSAGVADTSITTALASIDLSGFSFEKRLAIEDLQEFVTMFRQYNGVALMTQMVRRLPFSSIMNAGILAREEFVSFLMNTEVPGFRATDPRVSTEEKFRRIYDNARSTSIDQGSTVRADEPSPSNHRTGSRDGEVSGMAAISLLTSSNPATGRTLAQSAADMSKLVRSDMIFHMDEFVDKVSYRAWKEELALSFVRAEVAAEHRPLLVGLTLGGAIKEHYQQNARYDAPISDVFAILDNKVFSGEYNEHMMHNFETTKFSDLVVRMRGARTKAILYTLYHRVLKYAQNCLPDEYLGDKRLLRALRNAVEDEHFASGVLLKNFDKADDLYEHLAGCLNRRARQRTDNSDRRIHANAANTRQLVEGPIATSNRPLFARDLRHVRDQDSRRANHADSRACLNCNQPGHLFRACPSPLRPELQRQLATQPVRSLLQTFDFEYDCPSTAQEPTESPDDTQQDDEFYGPVPYAQNDSGEEHGVPDN